MFLVHHSARVEYLTLRQFIIYRDMFCAGRVAEEDLKRTMKACGGSIQTTVQNLSADALGTCASFEETQIGGERYCQ